ncbi:uncharacterized protein PgNI_04310 [Pyricularia grisea]|uniref:Cell cycle inhibitor Nif1 n=1 Tax=Pyricularia grisea TaxID=148305 RepID=A0A6P8BD26_PYRGI|nr:uncharacterized protein PgNI_04310 [Pyricularia grisea]TLD13659.1 hypothetical protein PgNI_04310 [Pyricularia grisea]
MAAPRPNFIDLRSQSQVSIPRPLKSPRVHVAGEAPPELSPLDAFALHSRMLAKQLEQSAKADKRISRLPPLTTESPLVVQARSEYFRSMSQDSNSDYGDSPEHPPLQPPAGFGNHAEIEEHLDRPMSMHPRMSRIPPTPDEPMPMPGNANQLRGRLPETVEEDEGFFGARRERSPSPMGSVRSQTKTPEPVSPLREPEHKKSPSQASSMRRFSFSQSPEKLRQTVSNDIHGLAPPRALFPQRSPSIISASSEVADDDRLSASSAVSPMHSHALRKYSTSSGGLASPSFGSFHRTPSIASDMSAPLPRPSFNFSRPLSRAGTPSFEPPVRQQSSDSHGSFVFTDDTAHTPVSLHSEGFPDSNTEGPGAPSYIYSKYSLPRGKMLQRSTPFEPQPQESMLAIGHAPPSPPTRPSSSSSGMPRQSLERSKLSAEVLRPTMQPSPNSSRPSTDGGRSSEDGPRGRTLAVKQTAASIATSDSASTVKPARSLHSLASAADIPAEEHVTKAIELHQEGKLNESTYHLRHAARQGHPTGMLLFALACRHGWGMRANPKEGVEWLRKAAECAGLEVADDEGQVQEGKRVDFLENKTRKAQFALSIYELGVSHMNGWGIDQDKALALRCFEIAGTWGDVDALAEAGFCYAQGIGCKKNLKKSAKFYRMAEAKGMNMVGNSWIHKSKYDDDSSTEATSPKSTKSAKSDKKARSKSRTRTGLFGKRHKAQPAE